MAGDAQLPTQIKELVLHLGETGGYPRRDLGRGEEDADGTVELIHRAEGFDPQAVLGDAGTITEAGGAVIAGARIDPAQAIAHPTYPKRYGLERTDRRTVGRARRGRCHPGVLPAQPERAHQA